MKALIFTLLIANGLISMAQIMNPRVAPVIVSPNQKQKPVSGKKTWNCSIPAKQEVAGYLPNSDGVPAMNQGCYHRSPSFNAVWAARFHYVLDSVMAATGNKGASMAVYVPGQGIFIDVRGISSPGIGVTPDLRFGTGSNTKLFIATVLTKLQEQGILSLDDPLYEWLPPISHIDSGATIRQLLSHQSGFFDYWNDTATLWQGMYADTGHFWTPQEILPYVGAPHFRPGYGYSYSNTNYLLAGMIIEAATGLPWAQIVHEYIFDPLVMDSTFVGAFENRNGPSAAEWHYSNYIVTNSPMTAEFSQGGAAGGILSTPREMTGWYSDLFNGAAVSDSSLREITRFEPTSFYGLGLFNGNYYNHLYYIHTGGLAGYSSLSWYDLQTGSAISLMMNDRFGDFNTRVIPILNVFYFEFPKMACDAGISVITNPWQSSCSAALTPDVMLTNYGSTPLTSVQINYRIDNGPVYSHTWSGNLGSTDTTGIILPPVTATTGYHDFTCYTSLPNGVTDGYSFNDTSGSNFIIHTLPAMIGALAEDFESTIFPPSGWGLSSGSFINWNRTTLARYSGNNAMVRNNYHDPTIGMKYDIDLPIIRVAPGTHPYLDFSWSYAMFPGSPGDSLQILVSNDCGVTWHSLFDKGGTGLQTSTPSIDPFYPQSEGEWARESLSLSGFPGDLMIRFRSTCGYGNMLYVDDLNIGFPVGETAKNAPSAFRVFPNPVKTYIMVEGVMENSGIILTDLSGRILMKREAAAGKTCISLQQLLPGIYLLKSGGEVRKLVKL